MPDDHSERPRLHEMFAVEMRPGLSESIRDLECLRSAIHATAVEGLFVMPAGANLEAAPESEQAFVRNFPLHVRRRYVVARDGDSPGGIPLVALAMGKDHGCAWLDCAPDRVSACR